MINRRPTRPKVHIDLLSCHSLGESWKNCIENFIKAGIRQHRGCVRIFLSSLCESKAKHKIRIREWRKKISFFVFFFCFDIETYCGKRMDWYLHLITSLGFPLEKYHPHPPEMIVPDISIHKKCKKKKQKFFSFSINVNRPNKPFREGKKKKSLRRHWDKRALRE